MVLIRAKDLGVKSKVSSVKLIKNMCMASINLRKGQLKLSDLHTSSTSFSVACLFNEPTNNLYSTAPTIKSKYFNNIKVCCYLKKEMSAQNQT